MLDQRTLYWLAGLLEAEGSFIAPVPSAPNTPTISISMTDEDVIARVAEAFGVKYHAWQSKNTSHKTTYLCHLRGYRGADLMRELYPLMSERRRGQIDRALTNYVYKPNKKGQNQGFSKLKDAQVIEIKRRLAAGESQKTIADAFNVSPRAISDINCGKTWGHITLSDSV
jgi:DNA-binding NarL/FixJ family response regulator